MQSNLLHPNDDMAEDSAPSDIGLCPPKLQEILNHGTTMMKYPNKITSRPAERWIKVAYPKICWESKRKKFSSVDFHAIVGTHKITTEIRLGQNTPAFKSIKKDPLLEQRSFSIIYIQNGKHKMLNLVTETHEQCISWVTGLNMLQTNITSSHLNLFHLRDWLHQTWFEFDIERSNKLNLDQVTGMMKHLNIPLSKTEIKGAFKHSSLDALGTITFDSFERLYRAIKFRPEIAELFSNLESHGTSGISFESFLKFLTDTQKVVWDLQKSTEVYTKYSSTTSRLMEIDHFTAFLLSSRIVSRYKYT